MGREGPPTLANCNAMIDMRCTGEPADSLASLALGRHSKVLGA